MSSDLWEDTAEWPAYPLLTKYHFQRIFLLAFTKRLKRVRRMLKIFTDRRNMNHHLHFTLN